MRLASWRRKKLRFFFHERPDPKTFRNLVQKSTELLQTGPCEERELKYQAGDEKGALKN